jgi:hypothetical protein
MKSDKPLDIITSERVHPRSPLSTVPIVQIDDEWRAGALPIEWKDDLEPYQMRYDAPGPREIIPPLAYADALEHTIEVNGGIKNVMVLPDGVDPDKEVQRFFKSQETERARQFYRDVLGWDV